MGKRKTWRTIGGVVIAGAVAMVAFLLAACGGGSVRAEDVGIPALAEVTVYQSRT